MIKFFIPIFLPIFLLLFPAAAKNADGDYVVLLHGLGRTSRSMSTVEDFLSAKGYTVLNLDYASRKAAIPFLADSVLAPAVNRFCTDSTRALHFVTHSMGGIIVRYYLSQKKRQKTGRVVMLSPPNKGSEVVDFFEGIPVVKNIMGPAFSQLSADSNSFVNHIKSTKEEIGVITGSRTINFINSIIIPGADDGKVSVKRARLDEMSDFLVVKYSHPFIMNAPEVHNQILYFLKNGCFKKTIEEKAHEK